MKWPQDNFRTFLVLVALALAVHTVLPAGGRAGSELGPRSTAIRAEALPLDAKAPSLRDIGQLRYVAGWSLRAEDTRFGGWSGLVVGAGGRHLVAVSDQGDWLTASLDIHAAEPLSDSVIQPFQPDMADDPKSNFDAESLIEVPDGGYIVGFEQKHRLYSARPGGPVADTPYTKLIDFEGVGHNGGMEAITFLHDGRLLVFFENPLKDPDGRLDENLTGWVGDTSGGGRLSLVRPEGFSVTDAATMAGGDILLLMRDYNPLTGVKAKILRLKASDIAAGATVEGQEIASFGPDLNIDNMEGLSIVDRADGPPLLFLISDDNFRLTQRTLLLVFELQTP